MDDVMTIETEEQRRGQAFMRALEQLKREYNCTTTAVPKWKPLLGGTFVLSFDEQTLVGPAPEKREEKTDETKP